jgi:DNA primase
MIPKGFIQDLLNRIDIVDVVERHVALKKAGANYVARCPFHNEKTPSFTVSQTKQFYHCFGCGAHGTAIGFLMQYDGLGYVEAVKELAQQAGLALPELEREAGSAAESARSDALEALKIAAGYYQAQLKRSEAAIGYLKSRGLTGEIAARFGLGYAPAGSHNLAAIFPSYDNRALVDSGLVAENESSRRYDRFRDRIMFPILSTRGAVIGFGGRVLDAGEPKYLNSPETRVFEKGRELYGLFEARQAIRDSGRALVVEGYMDVVALAQHRIGYAVATLGTATTPAQVQKLLRQCEQAVFCFDGDEAGRRAAWRALEVSLPQLADGKQVRFLFLPEGDDPDSFVRRFGAEAFIKRLEEAQPLSGFLFEQLSAGLNLKAPEERAKLVQSAKPLIKRVAAPALKVMLGRRLAELAQVSFQELNSLIRMHSGAAKRAPVTVARAKPSIAAKLIEMLVFEPRLARFADRRGPEAQVSTGVENETKILFSLLEFLVRNPDMPPQALLEHFGGSELEPMLGRLKPGSLWEQFNAQELEQEFAGAWAQLLGQLRHARVRELLESYEGGWKPEERAEFERLNRV